MDYISYIVCVPCSFVSGLGSTKTFYFFIFVYIIAGPKSERLNGYIIVGVGLVVGYIIVGVGLTTYLITYYTGCLYYAAFIILSIY